MTNHAISQDARTKAQLVGFANPQVLQGTSERDAEPPQIMAYNENVLVLWHEAPTPNVNVSDVFISWSTQGGGNFGAEVNGTFKTGARLNLSDSVGGDSRDEDIAVVAQATWNVFVVWVETSNSGGTDVFLRRARKDGQIFRFEPSIKVNVGAGEKEASRPQIVARRVSDNNVDVYVVWQALQEYPNNPDKNSIDIFFRESHNSGASFKDPTQDPPKNVSNTPRPDLNALRENSDAPQIALTANGRVVVTWRDSSLPNQAFDIFVASQQ